MSVKRLTPQYSAPFSKAARPLLADTQLRRNVRHATDLIQLKRQNVVSEMDDWQALRESGRQIRQHTLNYLSEYLEEFEKHCVASGGHVHWASTADEARHIALALVQQTESTEVLKIKSMTTEEIDLNAALERVQITVHETDLAEMIIQLGDDQPSHIVVPALHKNRHQVRELFQQKMERRELGNTPQDLTDAARLYLREKFFSIPVAISGANFLIAETGGICIVESEGNARMCLTLPRTLITIAGIDKILPTFQDLEVMLQLLPRSATGERMNPYNSIWTGTSLGDGPQNFHVILLDNARTEILADSEARQTLQCIRCGACQNVCPVYRQTGGHAYGSVYAGPIGAILTPQLQHMQHGQSLPYASSLCGACYEVCPVKIDIPEVLINLRNTVVQQQRPNIEALAMKMLSITFGSARRFRAAQRLGRLAQSPLVKKDQRIHWLPGTLGGWTQSRDLKPLPAQTFRSWWKDRTGGQANL